MTAIEKLTTWRTAIIPVIHSDKYSSRMLTVSMAHIHQATDVAMRSDLDEESMFVNVAYDSVTSGWLLHTSEEQEEGALFANEPALSKLLEFARTAGYSHLKLDSDGPILPAHLGFEVFEWD